MFKDTTDSSINQQLPENNLIPFPNFTQVPNIFFDKIAPTLKEGELRVFLVIMRQTFGWQKKWDHISLSQLQSKTGMQRKAVSNSLKTLLEKKLIQKNKQGTSGDEECFYTLIVEKSPDNECSNNSYQYPKDTRGVSLEPDPQYPKDTPPSILKIPTKETTTKEKEKALCPKSRTSDEVKIFTSLFLEEIRKEKPDFKEPPNLSKWEACMDKILRIDKRDPAKLKEIILWVTHDSFWKTNILSPDKLRDKFDQLDMKLSGITKIYPIISVASKVEERKKWAQGNEWNAQGGYACAEHDRYVICSGSLSQEVHFYGKDDPFWESRGL